MLRPRFPSGFPLSYGPRVPHRRPRPVVPAAYERLEDRTLLTAFVVNSLADGPAAVDGQLTLREALTAANTNAASGDTAAGSVDGDTITFSAGLSGTVALTEGQLVIADDVRIDGGGRIVIDAGGLPRGSSRVLTVETDGAAGSVDVSLAALTLTGGEIVGRGGGIEVTMGETVTLSGVVVSGNQGAAGGGIWNEGTLVINGSSSVTGNTAVGASGGGIYNRGGVLRVLGSSIVGNVAVNTYGGGIYSTNGTIIGFEGQRPIFASIGEVVVYRSAIDGNSADEFGGGVEVHAGRFVLDQSTLSDNTATRQGGGGDGGGLHVFTSNAAVTIHRSVVRGNSGTGSGGGLWNQAGVRMVIERSVLAGNVAAGARDFSPGSLWGRAGGGGVFNNAGELLVIGSLISDNAATGTPSTDGGVGTGGGGGGILSAGGLVTIYATTVRGNAATRDGGGVGVRGGRLVLDQSLVEGNSAGPVGSDTFGLGGGVHIADAPPPGATVVVHRTEVRGNRARINGGGLFNSYNSRLTLDRAIVTGNVAEADAVRLNFPTVGGGGVFNNGGDLLVSASIVEGNAAAGGRGGGIFVAGTAATVYVSTVGRNTAALTGGGIEIVGGPLVLDRSVLSGNAAGGAISPLAGDGGGLHVSGTFSGRDYAYLYRSELRNNAASRDGGGAMILTGNGNRLILEGSVVSGNTAGRDGGGVSCLRRLEMVDCTVTNNRADADGGGIHVAVRVPGRVVESVMSQNEAARGGGVFNAGQLTLTTTDVFFNDATARGGGVYTDTDGTTDVDALDQVFTNLPDDFAGPGAVV